MERSFVEIAVALCGHEGLGLAPDVVADLVPGDLLAQVPATLLRFWHEVGAANELLSCFHRFRRPSDIELHDGNLIFLEENQHVVLWAVSTGDDDPPVLQYPVLDEGLDGPFPEGVRLADFLRSVLVMQAAQGSDFMPHVGYVEREAGGASLLANSGLAALPPVGDLAAFFAPGIAATVVGDEDSETIIVGTRTEADLERFAALFGLSRTAFEL